MEGTELQTQKLIQSGPMAQNPKTKSSQGLCQFYAQPHRHTSRHSEGLGVT